MKKKQILHTTTFQQKDISKAILSENYMKDATQEDSLVLILVIITFPFEYRQTIQNHKHFTKQVI